MMMATTYTVTEVQTSSGVRWQVARFDDGKRGKRSFFASREIAEMEAAKARAEVANAGSIWANLPEDQKEAILLAWLASKGKVITDSPTSPARQNALEDVILEYAKSLRVSNCRESYVYTVELLLSQFAKGRERLPIQSVTHEMLEAHLASVNPNSRSTVRARLSALFRFAITPKHYLAANPCDGLPKTKRISNGEPEVLTTAETVKAIQFLRKLKTPKGGLIWFILTTLCGLRPEEAMKCSRQNINLSEGWIKVLPLTCKTNKRRIVNPRPEALRLLGEALADKKAPLPVGKSSLRRVKDKLGDRLGWVAWKKDATRHTAASMWANASQSLSETAMQLGNSEKVLKERYLALVTKAQAAEFWQAMAKV